jgi:hypothetical protein
VKGNSDDYAHFLARSHNANLLDVSSPFRFEIKSRELSSLILRRVSVWGQCSNSYHLQDAFIGLMIALPGSGFSTRAPGQVDLKACDHHSIHWHFASDEQVYSHHLDSDVFYIRIETARFLRLLACKGLAIFDIMALHSREASSGLIRLCEQIELFIEKVANPEEGDQWADQFLIKLVNVLQFMVYSKTSKFSSFSGTYVAASLQWVANQSSAAAISLNHAKNASNKLPESVKDDTDPMAQIMADQSIASFVIPEPRPTPQRKYVDPTKRAWINRQCQQGLPNHLREKPTRRAQSNQDRQDKKHRKPTGPW